MHQPTQLQLLTKSFKFLMRLARVTVGALVPKRELAYPVKCLSTVVVHVEPSVSNLEKKIVHEKVT